MSTTTIHRPPPTPLDGGLPAASSPGRLWLPIAVAFAGYPVLWWLGLGLLSYPLAALLALGGLLRRGGATVAVPDSARVWLLFVAWTGTAVLVLDEPDRWVAYGYRSMLYLVATVLLLWVLRADHRALTDRSVLRSLSVLWFATVIGGLAAMVLPGVEVTTPVERLLPAGILEIGLVQNIVHLQFADASRFLGFTVGRPEAPYPFTNAWGSNFALLTPLVLATWTLPTSRRWRVLTGVLVVLATIPWVFSLNRGSWLSLSVGLAYVALRKVRDVAPVRFVASVAGVALVLAAVLLSPLGDLVQARTEGPGHSDEGRSQLYEQAVELTLESPVVGHGAPQPNELDPEGPSIGTHGQLWLLLVSHGLPAAVLYIGFFGLAWLAALRWRAPHAVWLEATLVVGAVQFPIYELLPEPTIILAVVAGLAIRGYRRQERAGAAT